MRLLFLVLSLSLAWGQKAAPPTAAQILQRYVQVTGGNEVYAKIKTVTMIGAMELKAQNVRGEVKMYRVDGGKYYTVMDLPGMGKQEDGSDGVTAWDKTVLGPRIKTGAEKFLASCASSALSEYGKAAIEMDKCYAKSEFSGEEVLDGKPAYKLTLTPREGKPEEQYYDKASGLLVRTKMVLPSPMGEVPIVALVDEYKKIDGLLTPVKLTTRMGAVEMVMSFSSVSFNDKIPDQMFALPPEIKALVESTKAQD